jgi:hypothetical protein
MRQTDLMGGWRIEVSPGTPAQEDDFLHLIDVGDRIGTNRADVALVREEGLAGVRFAHGGRVWTVRFRTTGEPGAELAIASGAGETVISLPNVVEPQSRLALSGERERRALNGRPASPTTPGTTPHSAQPSDRS